MRTHLSTLAATFALTLCGLLAAAGLAEAQPARTQLAQTLAETGLYADVSAAAADRTLASGVLEFRPRFPLWTDGLIKRRWILVPAGQSIDASDPDHWQFPVGTKVWKEFALPERPVETRLLERTADGWSFATYVWDAAGASATLAPPRGLRGVAEVAPGVRHNVPGRFDCASCHEGQTQRVLGFGAVQLATGRTGDMPDLAELVARGLVIGLPAQLLEPPPVASHDRGEAALGYLHGNCGHCHNSEGPLAGVGMDLRMSAFAADGTPPAVATTLGQRARSSARAASAAHRIEPGDPTASQLIQRLSTRDPLAQMPPLGTQLVDRQAVDLLVAWIQNDLRADDAVPPVPASDAPASR